MLTPIERYAQAIRNLESRGSGGYSALGPLTKKGDRAYGAYQVMGDNIPSWTKDVIGQALTPDQFLADRDVQDAVFRAQFGKNVEKYGNPYDAASVWFTGRPMGSASGASADILGTTGNKYVNNFRKELGAPMPSAPVNIGATQMLPMMPKQEPKSFLQMLGLQKQIEGAQGEDGQKFYQRDTTKNNALNLASALNSLRLNPDAGLDARVAATQAQRKQAATNNATAQYLKANGFEDLAKAVLSGSMTGQQAYEAARQQKLAQTNRANTMADKKELAKFESNLKSEADEAALARANRGATMGVPNQTWNSLPADTQEKISSIVLSGVAYGTDEFNKRFAAADASGVDWMLANEAQLKRFKAASGVGEGDDLGGALMVNKNGNMKIVKVGDGGTKVEITMPNTELIEQMAKQDMRLKLKNGEPVIGPDGNFEFEVIPNSERDEGKKADALADKKRGFAAATTKEIEANAVNTAADEIIDMLEGKLGKSTLQRFLSLDLPEAGAFGAGLANLGIFSNQEAVDLQESLKPIKSSVAFSRLQRMREESKTGGALGNVSNIELDLLSSTLGSLSQRRNPELVYKAVMDIKRIYNDILNDPYQNAILNASSDEEFDRLVAQRRKMQGEQGLDQGESTLTIGGENYIVREKG